MIIFIKVSEKMGLSFDCRRPVHNTSFWKNGFFPIIYCGKTLRSISSDFQDLLIVFSRAFCCANFSNQHV